MSTGSLPPSTGPVPASTKQSHLTRPRFGAYLVAASSLVVAMGLAAAWLVASLVGPAIFRDHLAQSGESDPLVMAHAEIAFRTAGTLAVAIGAAAALLTSVVVSLVYGRRVSRALAVASAVAQRVARGEYDRRMTDPGLGQEFSSLVASFNAMATDLEHVEATRPAALGDLAHELRTPIAALRGYHEALADGVRPLDADTLAVLERHTERLARLAGDIAEVIAAGEGRLAMRSEPVNLAAVVRDTVQDARAEAEARGVTLVVEAGPARVRGDATRLGQVVGNLVDNALEHTPRGGTVTVTVASQPDTAVLTVADTGEGIAAEHLPRLFERFYRVDPARSRAEGGSGIGLAVVQALVTAHNGTVTAASDGPGHGAQFVVRLPAAP
jgi:signal transduction histidine kinase